MIQDSCPPPQPRNSPSGWNESLATGAAGIALLHIERAQAGTGRWSTVQQWASAMTRGR